jgi:hypothetical protein
MTVLKPERCRYGSQRGARHRDTGRCPDLAELGATYCLIHRTLKLAEIRANDNPQRPLFKALRWGPMYAETTARRW